jgi:hypothetical protein
MKKSIVWAGAALFTLGAILLLVFVLPRIGGAGSVAVLPNGQAAEGPSPLAVAVASFGLAAGSALVGIGLGRWKQPRPSPHDGTPEA